MNHDQCKILFFKVSVFFCSFFCYFCCCVFPPVGCCHLIVDNCYWFCKFTTFQTNPRFSLFFLCFLAAVYSFVVTFSFWRSQHKIWRHLIYFILNCFTVKASDFWLYPLIPDNQQKIDGRYSAIHSFATINIQKASLIKTNFNLIGSYSPSFCPGNIKVW